MPINKLQESLDKGISSKEIYQYNSQSDEQQSKLVQDYYSEIKKCFESRNFERIEKIKNTLGSMQPESPLINIVYAHLALLSGDGESSYNYLQKYIRLTPSIDLYALNLIAVWNKMAKRLNLAQAQFTECMRHSKDIRTNVYLCLHSIDVKKSLGFYDTAYKYYKRLLYSPEGYKLILYIKLQIIHIFLLKEEYDKATEEIEEYIRFNQYNLIRRLKAYLLYKKRSFNELQKMKNDNSDSYVLYLLARMEEELNGFSKETDLYYEEAIKRSNLSAAIHNSYGNYLFKKGMHSEAAEQYLNALRIDPSFEPAERNMCLFKETADADENIIYSIDPTKYGSTELYEIEPDVEATGFFTLYEFLGYAPFKLKPDFLKRNPDLKPLKI